MGSDRSARDVLDARGVSKRFGATQALDGVDLRVQAGERVAVMGENGAGKSTLMKVFAGVHAPDAGTVTLDGEPFAPRTPSEAIAAGIATVYQEPAGFPHLTVLENLYVGRQPTRWRLLDRSAMKAEAASLLARLELPDRLLRRRMGDLSLADQQQVLIARAVANDAKVLILDEPTSILTDVEADRLFTVVDRLAAAGTAICYITHRFDELDRVADRFVVLRDGRNAGESGTADRDELLRMMGSVGDVTVGAGGELSTTDGESASAGDPVLEIRGLRSEGWFEDVSLTVHPGRVTGLYGLVGAGRSEVALALFGELPHDGGEITYRGRPYRPHSARRALEQGLAYLPEDRKTQGIFPHMSVAENLAVAALRSVSRWGVLRSAGESTLAATWMRGLAVKATGTGAPITSLSGGNQQKVLLARLMATNPHVLILDEPTRGIDVATKKEIHRRIRELVATGVGVLLISSEMAELLELSDVVHVLHEGRVSATFDGGLHEGEILRAAAGVNA